jgi:serine/threonine protein kinase
MSAQLSVKPRCLPFAVSDEFYRQDTPSEMRLMGTKERYRLEEHLGQGAYGSVFKAKDLHTGQVVAVKRIEIDEEEGKEHGIPVQIYREISCLRRVQHENVVKLQDVVLGARPSHLQHFAKVLHERSRDPTRALHHASCLIALFCSCESAVHMIFSMYWMKWKTTAYLVCIICCL